MYNIYVPFDDISSYSNYYFSEDLSLIYATNNHYDFTIIDVNNHYSLVDTTNDVSSYNLIPIDNNLITNNWTYRNDLSDIFISLFFMILFFFGIPLFLISRLFKKRF